MKYYNVKATTELYNTHLKHCLKAILTTEDYDDFLNEFLSQLPELKYIMKDVQDSKINPVKLNTFLTFVDPTTMVDGEVTQAIYYGILLANRNYKNYRKLIKSSATKHLKVNIEDYKKSYKVVLKYAQNDISLSDCVDYILHYTMGSNIHLSSEMPCIELTSGDTPTQIVFDMINKTLLKGNYYPVGLNDFLGLITYLDSLADLYIYSTYNDIDEEIYKSERYDLLPNSLVHVSDLEKNIADRSLVTSIRNAIEKLSYEDAISLQKMARNTKAVIKSAFEETCQLFTYTYTVSQTQLGKLAKAFSFNPMTFTYLALLKHNCDSNSKVTMSIYNCVDLLKQSAISQFSMTEHLVTIYENDILIKQLCAQVCEDNSMSVKELTANYIDTLENKDVKISELSKELHDIKSRISNNTTKEVAKNNTIASLKKEILQLQSKVIQLEDERAFYKAIVDSELNNDELETPVSETVYECLEDVLSSYPNLKIAIVTKNNNLISSYEKLSNIKIVNAWNAQFDTRPIKEADIVVINTLQLDHSITYRVKSAITSKTKLFFTKNSNLNILNNYLISLIKTHGETSES